MTEEVGIDRPDALERVAKITQAIAFAIRTSDIGDALPDGIEWRFDSVGPDTSKAGRITIEGYRDGDEFDEGVEVVLQIKSINYGPHRLVFEADPETTASTPA